MWRGLPPANLCGLNGSPVEALAYIQHPTMPTAQRGANGLRPPWRNTEERVSTSDRRMSSCESCAEMTTVTMVDSNIFLDILNADPTWSRWSEQQLAHCAQSGQLFANHVVAAEISPQFSSADAVETFFSLAGVEIQTMSFASSFLAGIAHRAYRLRGGVYPSILADFLIGAHAQCLRLPILTRDARRYRTYFPDLDLITPETHL